MWKSRSVNRQGVFAFRTIVWVVFILSLCTKTEAGIWQSIRDLFLSSTCRTQGCYDTAKYIRENQINSSIEPCHDFYDFACGGWIANHPLPENRNQWTVFHEIRMKTNDRLKEILEGDDAIEDMEPVKKARRFYRACMDSDNRAEENMQYLLNRLSLWGGWPMATEIWDESSFTWWELLIDLNRANEKSPFLKIQVTVDPADSTKTRIAIDQADVTMCTDISRAGHVDSENIEARKIWMSKTAREIAKAANQNVSEVQITTDAIEVINFEIALCQAQEVYYARQDWFRMYNLLTLKELQNLTDSAQPLVGKFNVNWLAIITRFLEGSEIDVDENYTVILRGEHFLREIVRMITDRKISSRTLANYLLWNKITNLHDSMSRELREMGLEYSRKVGGKNYEPRWNHCVDYTNKYFAGAIGYQYTRKYFSRYEKVKMEELVKDILESFVENLKTIKWMDPKTRSLAVEKASNIKAGVGYPDWFDMENRTALLERFPEYKVEDVHLINLENARLVNFNNTIAVLSQPINSTVVSDYATTGTAFYAMPFNMFFLSAAIIQEPFYVKNRPEAMNYGAIGSVIAHEISHAFDLQGRNFDKTGNLARWWEKSTLDAYLVNQKCFEDQYAQYPMTHVTTKKYMVKNLNGRDTVGENIADNGGVQQAYNAYKKYIRKHGPEQRLPGLEEYSTKQLFFVGFASVFCEVGTPESFIQHIMTQAHSPNKYRINIPLNNFKKFEKHWKCPHNSKMTKHNKCNFW